MKSPTRFAHTPFCLLAGLLLATLPLSGQVPSAPPEDGFNYTGALADLKADLTRECTQPKQLWDGAATYSIDFRTGPELRGDDVVVAYVVSMTKTLNEQSGQPGRVINQEIFSRGDAQHPAVWGGKSNLRAKYPAREGEALPLSKRLEKSLADRRQRVLAAHQALLRHEADLKRMSAFYDAEALRLRTKWGDLILREQLESHLPSSIKPSDGPGLTEKERQMQDITTVQHQALTYKREAEERSTALEAALQAELDRYIMLKKALSAAGKPSAQLNDEESKNLAVGRTLLEQLQPK